jgi:hypothetical protein
VTVTVFVISLPDLFGGKLMLTFGTVNDYSSAKIYYHCVDAGNVS